MTGDRLVMITCAIVGAGLLIAEVMDRRDVEHKAYVSALESVVKACTYESSSAGNYIKIGDNHYLCGLQPLGRFAK